VTSREPLRIAGEQEFAVPPLSLPSSSSPRFEDATRSPAVALFIERAGGVRADFTLTEDNVAAVIAICRRLDGLPLAIELAAARIKVLAPHGLLDRLDHSLKLLSSGRRDASERQRTLRGAISWSYDLLSEVEQRLFSRLGVFAGGWSLDAAEQVCDRGDLDLEVLDGLASLVDKSLVRAVAGDEERFSMLETIREFATESLEESGEAQEIRRAHAEYFRGLAEEAEPHLVGENQKEWLDRLERDLGNIRAALTWSFLRHIDLATSITAATRRLWWVRGYLSEGYTWLMKASVAAPDGSLVKTKILRGLTAILQMQGDNKGAERLAHEGLALSRSLHDEEGTISFLVTLGMVAEERRDYDRAEASFQEAVEVGQRSGAEAGLAKLVNNLGSIALARNELERAEQLFNESLETQMQLGDDETRALTLLNLGLVALKRGSPQAARPLIIESLARSSSLGHKEFIVSNLESLAAIVVSEGRPRDAAQLLGLSQALQAATGFFLPASERQLRRQTLETIQQTVDAATLSRALQEGEASKLEDLLHRLREDVPATPSTRDC
nr:tetratricopeptide repeat protein [Actinomycetota bacterium]